MWEPKARVSWITLSPQYGTSNTITTELDQVGATVNTTSLAVGTNSGLVYIWESGPGVGRNITVPVTIAVTAALGLPRLWVESRPRRLHRHLLPDRRR